MLTYILFILGFIFLIKGADLLVKGGTALGLRLRVSGLIIGLTVVAFGTSSPELVVNIFASSGDASQIAIGNIIGSNIANILLILGLSAIIFPLVVSEDTVWVQIPLSLLAVVALGILASDALIDNATNSMLSRTDGIILLLFFYRVFILHSRQGEKTTLGHLFSQKHGGEEPRFLVKDIQLYCYWTGRLVLRRAVDCKRSS